MGDVTKTHVRWRLDGVPEAFGSPVAVDGLLYRLLNSGYVNCRKLDSGDEVATLHLPGVSGPSSPVATADGRIYFASAGKSFVVRAGPKLEILATNDLGDGCPASPAVADGRIYLKGRNTSTALGRSNRLHRETNMRATNLWACAAVLGRRGAACRRLAGDPAGPGDQPEAGLRRPVRRRRGPRHRRRLRFVSATSACSAPRTRARPGRGSTGRRRRAAPSGPAAC